MVELESRNATMAAPPADTTRGLGAYREIIGREPAAFLAGTRDDLRPRVIVFVGDSQGIVVKDTTGLAYPKLVARALAEGPARASVVSLHLGGANVCEQGTLLLALLEAGVEPDAVFWACSIYGLRKNEVRPQLVPIYRSLPASRTAGAKVVLLGSAPEPDPSTLPLERRTMRAATGAADRALSSAAAVRFSRRELWEKVRLLWESPLARLVPARYRPRSAGQSDPTPAIIEASASFAGRVTAALRARGTRVVCFLSPLDLEATPRPVTPRAEAIAYPVLEREIVANGGEYVSWLRLLPRGAFGRYVDGSEDAFHIKAVGHDTLAARMLARLASPAARPDGAAPAPPAPPPVALTRPRAPAPPR